MSIHPDQLDSMANEARPLPRPPARPLARSLALSRSPTIRLDE